MAPKVVVPSDFGIENLHCKFHGNVVLKLRGGEEMRANSLILSYHSSVFVRLFLELHQSVLEVDDFVGEAVKSFLGALYSGEIQLDRHLFRDVNKLCHVFKVDWLAGRCSDYFSHLIGAVSPSTDYQTLVFLFEEARFCMKVMKCDKFLELVVKKICGLENRAEIFVEPYMKNYTELETNQLDLMIQITQSNPVSLLKIMMRNFLGGGQLFDGTSRHLLQNLDLCKCIFDDEAQFEELFDILDSAIYSSDTDELFVNALYKKSVKEVKKKVGLKISEPTTSASSRSTSACYENSTEIPHIFCSWKHFSGMTIEEFLDAVKVSPLVQNLYMLIEGLSFFRDKLRITPDIVHEIAYIRRKRGWTRISPEFLESWHLKVASDADTFKTHGDDLTSKVESVRRVGKKVGQENKLLLKTNTCSVENLFCSPQSFAFYFKHPNTINCHLPGKCGFILNCTPVMKSGKPHMFKVNLCLDQKKYPEGLHIHPEFVKADKIHLVPMFQCVDQMRYFLATFTWNESGVSEAAPQDEGPPRWKIGLTCVNPEYSIKLTAFITL